MQKRSTRFLIDANVFISAVKKGWTETTELILHLLTNFEFELIANDVLLAEYEKYAIELNALQFLDLLKVRLTVINPDEKEVEKCKPYFSERSIADIAHAATCSGMEAILITNDKHFDGIKEAGLIEVWGIPEAISRLLE